MKGLKGVEVRGGAVRVHFRYNGRLCRETIPGPANKRAVEHAHAIAQMIRHEIRNGTFNYAKYFPESSSLEGNSFGRYLDTWLDLKQQKIAPGTMHGYRSRAEVHIRPRWGKIQADMIDPIDLEIWLNSLPLKNKTLREVLSIIRQVIALFRRRNPDARDPTTGITIALPDPEDPDPFTRAEIQAILSQDTDRPSERAMIEYMIWDGPRVSEAIALAWEDIDLTTGEITYRRSRVMNQYRVTKTRRSKRTHKLLAPALRALREQYEITGRLRPTPIEVLDRDNRTLRKQKVRFVWMNTRAGTPMVSDDYLRDSFFKPHLKAAGVPYRGPGQCRHTFASQMLSSGIVPIPWLVEHMGHVNTEMIYRRYAKWIREDAPDVAGMINAKLSLS
ncbi:phage integrase [Alcanivorax sp. S71-1-4]|uniref:Arm DNA-binding domain-containing protein n=1 Tax=Alcanivorax sp. S71-1-4 TaxID=1177159 RepID=UPI001359AC9D|nr:DUF3596 domain-containing protein [Alcanivorax sp. S71-1-4]KAF0810406.1 phage integrase [Alcanivorax sp. S71-1-4]